MNLAVIAASAPILLVIACCGNGGRGASGGKPMSFERVWTVGGDEPAGAGVLRDATITAGAIAIERRILDPATGAERWRADGALVGIAGDAAIVVRGDGARARAVERRELATGAPTGAARLAGAAGEPRPLRSFNASLTLAPGRLVHRYLGRAHAHDLATGVEAWAVSLGGDSATVVVSGDLVALVGDGAGDRGGGAVVVAVAAADGAERWRAPFDGHDLVASPRGGFFVSRGGRVVELGPDGAERRSVAGRFSAADGDLLAVTAGDDVVVVDGSGAEVDRISPAGPDDYVAAPGLCGGAVVYFRRRDRTVWWRPIGGREVAITEIQASEGLTRRGRVTAEATLTEPPRCAGALVLIQDWHVSAFRRPAP